MGIYGEIFDLKRSTRSLIPVACPGAGTPNGVSTQNLGSTEYWGTAVNVGYNFTSNFSVLSEVSYCEIDFPTSLSNDFGSTAGFLEFKRNI